MPQIWAEAYLQDLALSAEKQLSSELNLHWGRIALEIETGKSTYNLPPCVRRITRVTWQGKTLDPISFDEINAVAYNSAVVSEAVKHEYSTGEPEAYSLHPNNLHVLRLYPTPNEDIFPTGSEDLFGADIATQCIVSFYRSGDGGEYSLPSYISQRLVKSHVLRRAFLKEGKGQNIAASKYYEKKLAFQMQHFEEINAQAHISRSPALASYTQSRMGNAPSPPQLPWRFPSRKV